MDTEYCLQCEGTGIGRHGDPDTSKCTACSGRGYHIVDVTSYPEDDRDEDPKEIDNGL